MADEIEIVLPWGDSDALDGRPWGDLLAEVRQSRERSDLLPFLGGSGLDHGAPWSIVITWGIDFTLATGVTIIRPRLQVLDAALRPERGQPITVDAWRSVPISTAIEVSRLVLEYQAEHGMIPALKGRGRGVDAERLAEAVEQERAGAKRRGRPAQVTDALLQEIADIYREAVEGSAPTRPVREVAYRLEARFPGISDKGDQRAAKWVYQARRRGFIPPASETKGGE